MIYNDHGKYVIKYKSDINFTQIKLNKKEYLSRILNVTREIRKERKVKHSDCISLR